jgi:hypothetical protein
MSVGEMIPLAEDAQRLWDLVRYERFGLHAASLITDEEFAELVADGSSVARLEYYCYRILAGHGAPS